MSGCTATMQVALSKQVKIETMEEEIITLAGCDLGFIMPGKPPQVLQVEQGSEMAAHSIRTDDVLVAVDGRDTRSFHKDELEKLLRAASHLTFERPRADDVEMNAVGDQGESPAQETPIEVEISQPVAVAVAVEAVPPVTEPAAVPSSQPLVVHQLRSGMHVRLVNFQSAAMNGARGRLGKYSEKQGSWQVFLESTSSAKAVRPQNLEPLPGQREEATLNSRDAVMSSASTATANGNSDVAASLASSPVVAAMAAAMRGVVQAPTWPAFDGHGPGPPPGPEWQEDAVPADEDRESWVELMRDAYVRQIRADAEHPEPPPFHRANHFSAVPLPGQPLAEGKFPAQALNFQLQMLLRARTGDFPAHMAVAPYGSYGYGHSHRWPYGHSGFGHSGFNQWMPGRHFGGKGARR